MCPIEAGARERARLTSCILGLTQGSLRASVIAKCRTCIWLNVHMLVSRSNSYVVLPNAGPPGYSGAPEERRRRVLDFSQQGRREQAQHPEVELQSAVQRGVPEEVGRRHHGPEDPAQAREEAKGHRSRTGQESAVLIFHACVV